MTARPAPEVESGSGSISYLRQVKGRVKADRPVGERLVTDRTNVIDRGKFIRTARDMSRAVIRARFGDEELDNIRTKAQRTWRGRGSGTVEFTYEAVQKNMAENGGKLVVPLNGIKNDWPRLYALGLAGAGVKVLAVGAASFLAADTFLFSGNGAAPEKSQAEPTGSTTTVASGVPPTQPAGGASDIAGPPISDPAPAAPTGTADTAALMGSGVFTEVRTLESPIPITFEGRTVNCAQLGTVTLQAGEPLEYKPTVDANERGAVYRANTAPGVTTPADIANNLQFMNGVAEYIRTNANNGTIAYQDRAGAAATIPVNCT